MKTKCSFISAHKANLCQPPPSLARSALAVKLTYSRSYQRLRQGFTSDRTARKCVADFSAGDVLAGPSQGTALGVREQLKRSTADRHCTERKRKS